MVVAVGHGPVAFAPGHAELDSQRSVSDMAAWADRASTAATLQALASKNATVGKIVPLTVAPLKAIQALKGFGVATSDTLPWLSSAALDAELKDLSNLGFTWIRMDFDWHNIQPDNAASFDFAPYDKVALAASKYNIKIMGMIAYTPVWARPATCTVQTTCAPAHPSEYATFAAALATRYSKLGVNTWEIWNEPNLQGAWRPAPSATDYTALLKAAYAAIKQADASATVVSGGISSVDEGAASINQLTFLNDMYQAGARGSFDSLGYHSYSYPAVPDEVQSWSGWSMMNDLSVSLRSIMAVNGDGAKQIWSTEYGAPTNGPGNQATESGYDSAAGNYYVSEGLQAKMAAQAITDTRAASWAGPLFWYSYKDLSTDTSSSENFFGILRTDGSKKPAYTTFQSMLKN